MDIWCDIFVDKADFIRLGWLENIQSQKPYQGAWAYQYAIQMNKCKFITTVYSNVVNAKQKSLLNHI